MLVRVGLVFGVGPLGFGGRLLGLGLLGSGLLFPVGLKPVGGRK